MVKRSMAIIAIFVMVAVLFTACSTGSKQSSSSESSTSPASTSGAAKELVLAHVFAVDSLENKAAMKLADVVKEKSGGKYKVSVFPASQLGGFTEIVQQLQTGAVQMGFTSTSVLSNIGEVAVIDVWPYMFDSQEEFEKGYASEAGQNFLKQVEEQTGFKPLSPTYKGFRQLAMNKQIKSLDELKGLKLRVPGFNVIIDNFKIWGMAPMPMAVNDMFTGMQQNVVNGAEMEVPTLVSSGIQEVTKTLIVTNHAAGNYVWPMWGKFFNTLPPEDQKMLQEATRECSDWFTEETVKSEAAAYKAFEAAGATILKVDTTEWKKLIDTQLAAKYPDLYKIASAMREAGKR